jgi:hypothetical protein
MPLFNPVSGGETWSSVSGTSATLASNNGYIANNASRVSFALPTTAVVGQIFSISGVGAGGWKITQAAGQSIHVGASTTTVGTGGSIASNSAQDSVKIVCTVANTTFNIVSNIGSIVIT